MEIKIKRDFLEHLLGKASTVSVTGGKARFLKSFLLELDGETLKIVRTDMELVAIAYTKQVVIESREVPTRVLIDAEKFYDLVKSSSSDMIHLKVFKEEVEIEAGEYRGVWKTYDLSKYPSVATSLGKNVIKLDTQKFVRALERSNYAASRGQMQTNLRQVMFENGRCWATDMARYQEVVTNLPRMFKMTLPIVALDLVKFIALSGGDTIEFEETENFYFFKVKDDLFSCRHPHVKVVNESLLFKNLNDTRQGNFLVEVQKLQDVIGRIRLTAEVQAGKVHFEISKDDKTLIVSAKDDFKNKSKEAFPILLQGNKKETTRKFDMNWMLLSEALQAIKGTKAVQIFVDKEYLVLKTEDSKALIPMLKT
jgi:DNA polymerase III sliding clamp (beta) subunit (PCNA family)